MTDPDDAPATDEEVAEVIERLQQLAKRKPAFVRILAHMVELMTRSEVDDQTLEQMLGTLRLFGSLPELALTMAFMGILTNREDMPPDTFLC